MVQIPKERNAPGTGRLVEVLVRFANEYITTGKKQPTEGGRADGCFGDFIVFICTINVMNGSKITVRSKNHLAAHCDATTNIPERVLSLRMHSIANYREQSQE
jgi:hypothetical protein